MQLVFEHSPACIHDRNDTDVKPIERNQLNQNKFVRLSPFERGSCIQIYQFDASFINCSGRNVYTVYSLNKLRC